MGPERIPLICRPTPLHPLPRLSESLGVDLWIKRDDLTGFAGGGNKGRKIEFLLADALASHATAIVCQGASQSNFVRQLGAACSIFGLRCEAAVMDLPYYAAAGKPPANPESDNGNLLLDDLFGVRLHRYPDGDWEELAARADDLANELENSGERVYRIAIGGSSPLGAYSFALAGQEIDEAGQRFDFLVTPSSSGSTHAGLVYWFHGTSTRVVGISADPDPDDVLAHDIVELCAGVDQLTGGAKGVRRSDVDLRMEYCGEAYGIPSPAGNEALERFARMEGIVLDPVYSAKAAAGLLDLAGRGELGGRVLFWHTGGMPTLFALDPIRVARAQR